MKEAETLLFAQSQLRSFPDELARLNSGKTLKTTSPIISLNPTLEYGGLLTVGGRLANASLSSSQTHPTILHGKDPLTRLLISSRHSSLLHAGPTLLLSMLGVTFHITRARCLVRTVCRSCITCGKCQPQQNNN